MNRDDIIRMAREAGGSSGGILGFTVIELERFFKLAYEAGAAAERKRLREEIHSCHANCDHPVCVAVRKERKRFASECIDIVAMHGGSVKIEAAIRARGQE
jgi:hypothetical protein